MRHSDRIKIHDTKTTCDQCKDQTNKLDKNYNPDNNHYIDVTHQVTNFVDDSTSNIGLTTRTNIEPYIKTYLDLLHNYYKTNTLTLNKTKTKYTIMGTGQQITETRLSTIKLGQDKISCDGQVRILGLWFRSDNTLSSAVNELVKSINFRLYNLNKVKQYTDFKSRKSFALSFIVGKLNYLAPLYMSLSKEDLHKLHLIFTKTARYIWSGNTFKKSNKTILSACDMSSLTAHLQYSALNFVHKLIYTRRPDSLFSLFKMPDRAAKDIVPIDNLKSKQSKNFYLYKSLKLYNSLKNELKILKPTKFKVKLKLFLGFEGITN